MSEPVFLIGAGFAAEARSLAGPIRGRSIYIGEYEIECGYPLVGDLPDVCFPDANPVVPPEQVEERLAATIEAGEWEPLERLLKTLFKADYYLGPRLFGDESEDNPYKRFLCRFTDSSFISFNYDAFLEIGLLRAGRWSPHDGFGFKVGVGIGYSVPPHKVKDSQSVVVHPHGSLMIYTQEFDVDGPDENGMQWIRPENPPSVHFDPHSLGNLFYPFERPQPGLGTNFHLPDRIIAPVPDKATGKRSYFAESSMKRAQELVSQHNTVVAVGYAFAESDKGSYAPILQIFERQRNAHLVIVAPDCNEFVPRLQRDWPELRIDPVPMRFSEWVSENFPGVGEGDV